MREEDAARRGAALVQRQRQTVTDVAPHELDVLVVGRAVEEDRGQPLEAQLSRRRDTVQSVDDAAVAAADDDRRPPVRHLGERGHVAAIDAAHAR